jgi:hypothetical protein
MGQPKLAAKAYLISAFCYHEQKDAAGALEYMVSSFGPIQHMSSAFNFIHTTYYFKEMGSDLKKFFCCFENLIDPMDIVDIKLKTNLVEERFMKNGRRKVNIDPAYLEAAKLVVATTKNFSHRIYLGKGIYGDVQLFWRQGKFQSNPWTYPDYLDTNCIAFFTEIRKEYLARGED